MKTKRVLKDFKKRRVVRGGHISFLERGREINIVFGPKYCPLQVILDGYCSSSTEEIRNQQCKNRPHPRQSFGALVTGNKKLQRKTLVKHIYPLSSDVWGNKLLMLIFSCSDDDGKQNDFKKSVFHSPG